MTHLLDANVLIAVSVTRHVHHDRSISWLAASGTVAVCPIVEGALVRFLVRAGEPPSSAARLVELQRSQHDYQWWPDDLSYGDLDLTWVTGHRQVTDAYLVGLASKRSAALATLDERLALAHPDAVLLIP